MRNRKYEYLELFPYIYQGFQLLPHFKQIYFSAEVFGWDVSDRLIEVGSEVTVSVDWLLQTETPTCSLDAGDSQVRIDKNSLNFYEVQTE